MTSFAPVLGALTLALMPAMVVGRTIALRRGGVRAMRFGELDKSDYLLPPLMALYFYVIFAHAFGWPSFVRETFWNAAWMPWAGVICCLAAVAIMIASLIAFRASFRVGIDVQAPNRLITSGIFAFTRNPIYVAFFFLFGGEFLIFPNWTTVLYLLGMIVLVHRQVLREEAFLRSHYGDEYRAYSARVRRYLVLSLAATLALNGCSAESTRQPHVLRVAFPGDPASLVPLIAVDQDILGLDVLFCETLIGIDAAGREIPILVTRIPTRANGDISSDGKRITYHLRSNARFADGVPLTSADVAFTYHAIFDPRNRATSLESYRRVVSLETPDAHTVVIRLREPWNAAVGVLFAQADYAYGILPKHAFADTKVVGTSWEDAPFGTGPFRVTQWRRGDRIILDPNRYYSPKPKLSRIVLRIVPNLNSNFVALQSGAADIGELTPENVERAARLPGMHVARFHENATWQLYLNTQAAPTSNRHVRRAIAYAIDVEALANAWRREYPVATGFFPPPVVRWKRQPVESYRHDLQAAKRELDAAAVHAPITLLVGADAENPIQVRIATLLQAQLERAGMHVTIKTNPTRTWYSPAGLLRNGAASIVGEAWVGGGDPEQSLNLRCMQAVKGGSNHSFYCSPRFEGLFADQARTPSEAQRARDFDAIERLVHDDVPVIPIYYEDHLEGVSDRVTGFARNMLRLPVAAETWDVR